MDRPPRDVVVLGGGLAGLAAAYYINEIFGCTVNVTIVEATNSFGGWCKTTYKPGNTWFENGPRSFRGTNGFETLKLVHDLGLQDDLLFADKKTAKSRFIVLKGKLFKLGPLAALRYIGMWNLICEPFVRRRQHAQDDDESVFSFVLRRFGPGLANLASALLCGIYAGDATKLSIQAVCPTAADLEDRYGSVILGAIFKLLGALPTGIVNLVRGMLFPTKPSTAEVFAKKSKRYATAFTFKGGMGQLSTRLGECIQAEKYLGCKVKALDIPGPSGEHSKIVIHVDDHRNRCSEIRADHVISTIPAWALADVLRSSSLHSAAMNADPAQEILRSVDLLESIPFSSVGVVGFGLEAEKCPWPSEYDGFGYLVPPSEGAEVIGTLMESRTFQEAQSGKLTRVTVMINKEEHLQQSKEHIIAVAQQSLEQYLGLCFRTGQSAVGVSFSPLWVAVAVQRHCIPQYVLGHRKRVATLQQIMCSSLPQLTLGGQSFEAVGVNDTIRISKEIALELKNKWSN